MKKIALAAALSLAATSAFAKGHGKYSDPVVEPTIQPEVIEEATSSAAGGIIIPVMLLLLIAAAVGR